MNNVLVTTGQVPLKIGAGYLLQLQAYKDGVPWDLTGGSVTLKLTDPTGAVTTYTATITGMGAQYVWAAVAPAGQWSRTWTAVVGSITQISQAVPFPVVA